MDTISMDYFPLKIKKDLLFLLKPLAKKMTQLIIQDSKLNEYDLN